MVKNIANNCDREPIHILGKIQDHGFLIAINKSDFIVTYVSENISEYTNTCAANILGKHIDEASLIAGIITKLPMSQLCTYGITEGFDTLNPISGSINELKLDIPVNFSGEYLLLEYELVSGDDASDQQNMIGHSVAKILEGRSVQAMLQNTAQQVKSVIDYDRVMVYKFWEDGHGEVIAEQKNEDLESWLGLHYPSSDIPQQARQLYLTNHIRIISDVNSSPSLIITDAANIGAPLNLTYSVLRAVSPVHIEYLKNMGVAASFSISLIVNDELWGLIACHNYSQKHIDYRKRQSAKLIGQILSSSLDYKQGEENKGQSEYYRHMADLIITQIQKTKDLSNALLEHSAELMQMTSASGVAVVLNGKIHTHGIVPANNEIVLITEWLTENNTATLFSTDHLSGELEEAGSFKDSASGLFACTVSRDFKEYVLWFKPEVLKSVTWAGDPEKAVIADENNVHYLSPRNSFKAWTQQVINKSEPWSKPERAAIIRLRDNILQAISERANETRSINEKLREAYRELNDRNKEISKKLNQSVGIIKANAEALMNAEAIQNTGKDAALNAISGEAGKLEKLIVEDLVKNINID